MRDLSATLRARRRWLVAAGTLAFVAGVGLALIPRDRRQEPVSVRRQVGEFRAGRSTATPPGAPPAGVYVYDTTGGEEVRLLAGARHDYPARTTITVTAGGCGVVALWSALSQRRAGTQSCRRPDGAWRLRAETDVHEFFGRHDDRTYHCSAASIARPSPRARPGTRFRATCAIPGTREIERGVVVGPATVAIEGSPVPAVRLRIRTTVSGDTDGRGTTDLWLRAADGLVLRRREHNRNATGTIAGKARYDERYELRLRSLLPRR